ncbi:MULTISPECIES: arsenate reductase (glutaredoxin) [unclassified Vibrio]|uniref:Arsenate reductase n=1 Tax=Vibrio sp. HB236076 TaxID=3232307 RepID=A0AB39HHR2_9VIBR|nr:arsenate reductase (glutaredoxin) [Vibrio sp. HB161653]MDP5254823.1 arsenate reductase (glutaredoxin) [Vibrio sp. HB161653]
MSITLYHNPRCSKSRQALQLLTERGYQVEIVRYLETPLSVEELQNLMTLLKLTDATQMMRTKEAEFKQQNLREADQNTLLLAMANTPKLIERPIVVANGQARIGRPVENILEIL